MHNQRAYLIHFALTASCEEVGREGGGGGGGGGRQNA